MNRITRVAVVTSAVFGLIVTLAGPVSANDTATVKTPDANAVVISAEKAAKAKGCTLKAKGNTKWLPLSITRIVKVS